jgi:hypothetical protein
LILAAFAMATALASAIVAIWCIAHVVTVYVGLQRAGDTLCGSCYDESIAKLGLPLEQTIPIGILSGGVALVAAIQTIRCLNGLREQFSGR